MKFYEVTDQIVLTNHLIANNLFSIARSKWDSMNAEQQETLQRCAYEYREELESRILEDEKTLNRIEAEGEEVIQ